MQKIGKLRSFLATGDDFQGSNPVYAYYFFKYFFTEASNVFAKCTDPTEKVQIQAQINECRGRMSQIEQQGLVSGSDTANIKSMLEYTELMFATNDHYHHEGQCTKKIAQNFLTLYRLYEVISKIDKLSQQQAARRVYSMKKAIEIMKAVKKNGESGGYQPVQSPKPIEPAPPVFQNASIHNLEQKIMQSHFKPLPPPTNFISYDKIKLQFEATKHLQDAVSELTFDRYRQARQDILKALELLDQVIDS